MQRTAAKIVSEKTLLPLSLVLTLASAIAWLTGLHGDQKNAEVRLDHIDRQVEGEEKRVQELDERLSRLEGKLQSLYHHQQQNTSGEK